MAIQVVKSIDDYLVENGNEPKRKIKTIAKFGDGPSLEELFLSRGTKDLPILVFSITGKTRGGKSLLLNLMIKYLEAQDTAGWLFVDVDDLNWLTGRVPKAFAWSGGVDSVTRGLWVWPKVYLRRNSKGEKLGILLLDNEGMFDGEASDGEIIAMSGISTAISYLQMFNLTGKITTDNLENIVRNLVKGIEEIDSGKEDEEMYPEMESELQRDYRLMFVVRDWMGEDSHKYGLEGGEEYIKKDRPRGSTDNKTLWEEVHKAFSDVQCLLLPHPGIVATKAKFTNTGDLELLEQDFLDEVKVFVESLFAADKLILPQNVLTGEDIYSLLDRVDGKVANDDLSFMNMFTDHGNYIKVEKFKNEFESISSNDSIPIEDAKFAMDEILEEAEKRLRGKSASEHFAKLKMTLEGMLNRKVVDNVTNLYRESFKYSSRAISNHKCMWHNIQVKLREYLCGDRATVAEAKRKVAQITAKIYYEEVRKETLSGFKSACEKKDDLEGLAGLDEYNIKVNFEECIDFEYLGGSGDLVYPIFFYYQQLLKDEMTGILLTTCVIGI